MGALVRLREGPGRGRAPVSGPIADLRSREAARLPGAGRLPGCMHAAQLRSPQDGGFRSAAVSRRRPAPTTTARPSSRTTACRAGRSRSRRPPAGRPARRPAGPALGGHGGRMAAEMILPGFVIPACRRLARARVAALRAGHQCQCCGDRTRDCSGALGRECLPAEEVMFCLVTPRCWWSRRIGRNFLPGRPRFGVPQVRQAAAPAALDLGSALYAQASRGGA
jgi:hypothetical protein